jgi:hypothetical protein
MEMPKPEGLMNRADRAKPRRITVLITNSSDGRSITSIPSTR